MTGTTQPSRRSSCPINIALETFGDTWSLLIVRDLMFKGRKTYGEFLDGGEGIATNMLSDRLARLTASGIIEKRRDPDDARRFIYQLTSKGIDLAPLLTEMIVWSATHETTAAPPEQVRRMLDDRDGFLADIRAEWERTRVAETSRD